MKTDDGRNFSVHNLTFIRNNSYAQKLKLKLGHNYFFMMDYYNLLQERELIQETDGYMILVGAKESGINKKNDSNDEALERSTVARRVMGIYSAGNSEEKQIFRTSQESADTTTDTPFLGIIQIYITDYLCRKQEEIHTQHIDEYLNLYKADVEKCLTQVLDQKDRYQIFRTITAEDFCVAVRASSIRKIYDIVLKIMDVKNDDGKRIFFTYTNIGIESINIDKDAEENEVKFLQLSKTVLSQNRDVKFLLRFRLEKEALEDIRALKYLSDKDTTSDQQINIEDVKGMVGRYDLVVKLGMDEFAIIYPYLCKNAVGYNIETSECGDCGSELVALLVDKLGQSLIQTVNTRVMLEIYGKEKQDKARDAALLDKNAIERIRNRSQDVIRIFNEFKRKYESRFTNEEYRYRELNYMLESLMNSYDNLAYEVDTNINWFICSQYLEHLFKNMVSYMKHAQEVPQAIEKFLDSYQDFVSAFDAYLRLLQGINQNTIQAPKYDVSAPIDGQKFLIAYSEFIDQIHAAYGKKGWDIKNDIICHEKRRAERTIIYPDIAIKNLELTEVFDYDRGIKKEKVGTEENSAILICKIPMFEYFERPYDLIPLVSHEICHHMLILKREIRNGFLISRIFKKIAREAVNEVQIRFVKDKYMTRNDSLSNIMTECLSSVLIEDYNDKNDHWEQYAFQHLKKSAEDYVSSFFAAENEKKGNLIVPRSEESVMKDFKELAYEIYSDDEAEKKIKILTELHLKYINPDHMLKTDVILAKFIEEMLEQINEETVKCKNPINIRNMHCSNIEFDNIMLEWVKTFKETLSKHDGTTLDFAKEQEMMYYLSLVKKTYFLYSEAIILLGEKGDNTNVREKIAELFAKKAKEQYEYYISKDEYHFLYDQDKAKKSAFWEFKITDRAKEHYLEAMESIVRQKIEGAIEFSIKEYRESSADVIMSRWLGFNSFGYFRMSITQGPRMMRHSARKQNAFLQRERLTAVLAVLIQQETPEAVTPISDSISKVDLKILWSNIEKYIADSVECTKKRIKNALLVDNILSEELAGRLVNEFFKMFDESIELAKNYISKGRTITWADGIWDAVCREKMDFFEFKPECQSYFQKEVILYKRIYDMLEMYGELQKNGIMYIETDLLEHMTGIYENMIEGKPLHGIVEEVVRFYNDPMSEKKTNAQKLFDMLQFVQDYYYCNRIRKAEENLK